MKIAIAAIGLLKSGPEKQLAADYELRIPALGRTVGLTGLLVQDWPESRAATTYYASPRTQNACGLRSLRVRWL
jgi:23S rRNA (pseudouridine1915-N3)-methyltransferase